MGATWTRTLLSSAALALALTGCAGSADPPDRVQPVVLRAVCTSANSRMNVVAHEDDDLLFMDPATTADVAAGRCLTTVYLTAGDDGQGPAYWHGREDGAMAAYAQMAGRSSWTTTELITASGQAAVTRTLDGANVRLVFLRLPTGSPGGRAIHHHECLGKLHAGTITTVNAVDDSASYTSASLRATLTGLMTTFRPSVVRTLDYTDAYGDGDHADHHNASYYAYEAQRNYLAPHRLEGFRGYPISTLPANQPDAVAARKLSTFLAYSAHDPHACQTAAACRQDSRYWSWMSRSYQVSGPPAPAVWTAATQ